MSRADECTLRLNCDVPALSRPAHDRLGASWDKFTGDDRADCEARAIAAGWRFFGDFVMCPSCVKAKKTPLAAG